MENKIEMNKENAIKWLKFLLDEIDTEYGSGKAISEALNYAIDVVNKVEE